MSIKGMNKWEFKKIFNDLGGLIMLVIIVGIFTLINPNFINMANIKNILFDITPLLIMAMGITYVLLIGSIDLSVGSIASLSCVLTGLFMPIIGYWIIVAILLFGLIAGLINGILLVKLQIPSFIITLCTASIWGCIALILSKGRSKSMPASITSRLDWSTMTIGVIPVLFVIGLVLLGILYFIQVKTVIGKSTLAVGASQRVARVAGLKVNKVKVTAFVICGICSSLCGFFLSIKMFSSLPRIGDPMTLLSIASVVLGGSSLSGGKGSVLKTFPGVLIVLAIQSGFNVVQVDPYWQRIAFGALVLFAVFINTDRMGKNLTIK